MKKQLIPALFLFTLLMACEEIEPSFEHSPLAGAVPAISSFSPESAAGGTEIILYGQNFGTAISDNYVTFDNLMSEAHSGRIAEVTKVLHDGEIMVRVPMNMVPGYYTISLQTNGQTHRADKVFIIRDNNEF